MNAKTKLKMVLATGLAISATNYARAGGVRHASSLAVAMMENQRDEFEKQINSELKDWNVKIGQLRTDAKKTHWPEKHHRHLKRTARHMESDVKHIEHQLARLKKASEKEWGHFEEQIKTEIEDMKNNYEKVTAE